MRARGVAAGQYALGQWQQRLLDKNADAFANLGRNFNGSTVQGVGFDEDVLIRAGVEECDVLAAVTQLDNTNLMCAWVRTALENPLSETL